MKTLVLMVSIFGLVVRSANAETPRGAYLELHSCELFAGGCKISSEATLEGRYLLTAWKFSNGELEGVALKGLNVAVLQAASESLAAPGATAEQATVYLPAGATERQQQALRSWVRGQLPELHKGLVRFRSVPIEFRQTGERVQLSIGASISATTASLETCDNGNCGEALWYAPRTIGNVFTVAVNNSSQVSEPWMHLKWRDAGKRSVFLGRFGQGSRQSVYVTSADLCGSSNLLF